jgi:acyl carrier protein
MNKEKFLQDFADCFEDTDVNEFQATTIFKDLEEWDSLTTLAIIGMCAKKYNVKIAGAEIHESNTISDVYNLVVSKSNGSI